jgi:NAD(P)-dependent dehydrogenase (short-subunit alcohol dehydrogenase family)
MTDAWRLDGRVAIVTGAGRGIGRGCATALAEAGATVLLVARTERELHETIELATGDLRARPTDATEQAQVTELFAEASRLGDIGVLVCAAGTNRPGPALDYPISDWDDLFAVNVRATFLCCQAFAEHARRPGGESSIVLISSQMGSVGYPGRAPYCATKHAVNGLTRALAVEWAKDGIRVNAVAPTFVETPMTTPMLADPAFREEILKHRLPTGRLAQVDDISHAVRYLACPPHAMSLAMFSPSTAAGRPGDGR